MSRIEAIYAREILDARGYPTLEVRLMIDTGFIAVAQAPSSSQSSPFETGDLRDQDPSRYAGLGELHAAELVNTEIAASLKGQDPTKQADLDYLLKQLDGTEHWQKFGVNIAFAVSAAICKAGSAVNMLPIYRWVGLLFQNNDMKLPTPIFNIISGGTQGTGNNVDFQEILIIPQSIRNYPSALKCGTEIYLHTRQVLMASHAIYGAADDGGFAPNLFSNLDAFVVIAEASKRAGYHLGQDVIMGLDVAAQNLFKDDHYTIRDRTQPLPASDMFAFYKEIVDTQPVFYFEDPFAHEDWLGWKKMQSDLGKQITIATDDMTGSYYPRVNQVIGEHAANAVILKSSQAGTVSEALDLARAIRAGGCSLIVANQVGETEDAFIADIAVGIGADYCKFGAPARGERIIKYNRLSEIYTDLFATE